MAEWAVVDASVAVKWVIAEEFSDRAAALYTHAVRAGHTLIGPPLLTGEVANTILQRNRRGDISDDEAAAALSTFLTFQQVDQYPVDHLVARAYDFCRRHSLRTIYDALYVVLAEDLSLELWTDDRRLLTAVRNAATWVRWIAVYPVAT